MGVYKRKAGGSYWVRFRVGGKEIDRSAHTLNKKDAEEYEQALRNRFWRQRQLGETQHTWKEAVTRYRKEAQWAETTTDMNERAIKLFAPLEPINVAAIDDRVVCAARERIESVFSVSYADRCMSVMRGILNKCEEPWKWITKAPHVHVNEPPERDPIWLTPEQCEDLVSELPSHTRAPAVFSAITGIRMGNVRDLKWTQIDISRRIAFVPSSSHKNRTFHAIPLGDAAITLLRSVPQIHGNVFVYCPPIKGGLGEPRAITGTFNTKAYRKARIRAGLPDLRWHDLRHVFASWLALTGASDRVLMLMGGWLTSAMVKKYAHLRTADMLPWANAVGANAGAAIAAVGVSRAENTLEISMPAEGIEPPTPSLRKLRVLRGGK